MHLLLPRPQRQLSPLLTQPPPAMPTANSAGTWGTRLFFANHFSRAEGFFAHFANRIPLFALAHAALAVLRALMTFEAEAIALAQTRLGHAEAVAKAVTALGKASQPQSSTAMSWLTGKSNGTPRPAAVHAGMISAESSLLRALLHLLGESVTGLVSAGLAIRSGWNGYCALDSQLGKGAARLARQQALPNVPLGLPECMAGTQAHSLDVPDVWPAEPTMAMAAGDAATPAAPASDAGSILFGIGTFNVIVSALPTVLLNLVTVLGFSGDARAGLAQLGACAFTNSMRAPLACQVLLAHTVLMPSFVTGVAAKKRQPAAAHVLAGALRAHPTSAIFLWLAGRAARGEGAWHLSEQAFAMTTAVACGQRSWRQLYHLCAYERAITAMCNALLLPGGEPQLGGTVLQDAVRGVASALPGQQQPAHHGEAAAAAAASAGQASTGDALPATAVQGTDALALQLARSCWTVLEEENTWSRPFYAYMHALCLGAHAEAVQSAEALARVAELAEVSRSLGGRRISVEQWAVRRAQEALVRHGADECVHWDVAMPSSESAAAAVPVPCYTPAPLLEAVYLFNGFACMSQQAVYAVCARADSALFSMAGVQLADAAGQVGWVHLRADADFEAMQALLDGAARGVQPDQRPAWGSKPPACLIAALQFTPAGGSARSCSPEEATAMLATAQGSQAPAIALAAPKLEHVGVLSLLRGAAAAELPVLPKCVNAVWAWCVAHEAQLLASPDAYVVPFSAYETAAHASSEEVQAAGISKAKSVSIDYNFKYRLALRLHLLALLASEE